MQTHTSEAPASTPRPITAASWPNLTFDAGGLTTLANIANLLANTDGKHPKAKEIREEFVQRMDYLNGYGGPMSETDPRLRFKVYLGSASFLDPYDFGVMWKRLNPVTGEYTFAMNGAMVCHGVPGVGKPVSLEPQWWGIHT